MQIPVVSMNDEGKVVVVSEENEGGKEPVNKEKRKLTLCSIPFSLTCILYKNYILADPTAEEESIMETLVTVVLDSSGQLVSLYKPGGPVLAYTSAIQVGYLVFTLMSCHYFDDSLQLNFVGVYKFEISVLTVHLLTMITESNEVYIQIVIISITHQ